MISTCPRYVSGLSPPAFRMASLRRMPRVRPIRPGVNTLPRITTRSRTRSATLSTRTTSPSTNVMAGNSPLSVALMSTTARSLPGRVRSRIGVRRSIWIRDRAAVGNNPPAPRTMSLSDPVVPSSNVPGLVTSPITRTRPVCTGTNTMSPLSRRVSRDASPRSR